MKKLIIIIFILCVFTGCNNNDNIMDDGWVSPNTLTFHDIDEKENL